MKVEGRREEFKKSLEKAGGKAFEIDRDKVALKIKELFGDDKNIVSYIKDCKVKNIDEKTFQSPHDLKDIDIAVVESSFGVAENGAVWCDDRDIEFRAIFFITKVLIVILKKENIVKDMHEAYEKLDLTLNNFGIFISGPSKTADIEQSLVLGAHGAIEHLVFLV